MSDKKRGLAWLWVLLIIGAVAALAYGWYIYSQPKTGEEEVSVEISVSEEAAPGESAKEGASKGISEKAGETPGAEGNNSKAGEESAEEKNAGGAQQGAAIKPQPTGEMVTYQFESEKTRPSETETPDQAPDQLGRTDEQPAPQAADEDRKARYCKMMKQYVRDYFDYLDTQKYVQNLNAGQSSYARFKQVMDRLSAHPPIPAGEGVDPAIMVKNIYFFCRALDKKDLYLIKEVVSHDRDDLEDNMGLFYQWLMLGKRCPDPNHVRPSFDVLYRYAGFFLNTTGGRAYMFRRGLKVRLLVSYYAVQIIYQADKAGKNNYGINVLPYIKMLTEEMKNYPDLLYKDAYLKTLSKIKAYYSKRR